MVLIAHMDRITTAYLADNMALTLRQLYYRLVAAALIPNTEKSYARVGRVLSDARLSGDINWSAIVDRERSLQEYRTWTDADHVLRDAVRLLRYDHWREQSNNVEVWVEKKALISVVARACGPYRVRHFACKGYVSQSALYEAAQRIRSREQGWESTETQRTIILYLGDHDPSGLDMPRDILSRLQTFGADPDVDRIALTRGQINQYNPPPNPAKVTDSRFQAYQREHGDESWELDALEPQVLIDVIRDHIDAHIDPTALEATVAREDSDRAKLRQFGAQWTEA
jgi:hypothetical protein